MKQIKVIVTNLLLFILVTQVSCSKSSKTKQNCKDIDTILISNTKHQLTYSCDWYEVEENDTIIEQGKLRNGKKHGRVVQFYNNGLVKSIQLYHNGEKYSYGMYYNNKGQLEEYTFNSNREEEFKLRYSKEIGAENFSGGPIRGINHNIFREEEKSKFLKILCVNPPGSQCWIIVTLEGNDHQPIFKDSSLVNRNEFQFKVDSLQIEPKKLKLDYKIFIPKFKKFVHYTVYYSS